MTIERPPVSVFGVFSGFGKVGLKILTTGGEVKINVGEKIITIKHNPVSNSIGIVIPEVTLCASE